MTICQRAEGLPVSPLGPMPVRTQHTPEGGPFRDGHPEGSLGIAGMDFRFEELISVTTSIFGFWPFHYPAALLMWPWSVLHEQRHLSHIRDIPGGAVRGLRTAADAGSPLRNYSLSLCSHEVRFIQNMSEPASGF